MNTKKSKIENALGDVRRAYRLLHNYQRAALDAAKFVGTKLGFEYNGGYALFSDTAPRNGGGDLNSWAWDWLNMVFYDFNFVQTGPDKKPFYLSILLISDTGYFESLHKEPEKLRIETFREPERSSTKVGLVFFREWFDQFDGAFLDDREAIKHFVTKKGALPKKLVNSGVRAVCCDFSDIADEAAAAKTVSEVAAFAVGEGFPVQVRSESVVEEGRVRTRSWMKPRQIPNDELKQSDIPESLSEWERFALTFNGYKVHGSHKACAAIANKKAPRTLTEYRTCLFFEQRRWRHFNQEPDDRTKRYLLTLLAGIRKKVLKQDLA